MLVDGNDTKQHPDTIVGVGESCITSEPLGRQISNRAAAVAAKNKINSRGMPGASGSAVKVNGIGLLLESDLGGLAASVGATVVGDRDNRPAEPSRYKIRVGSMGEYTRVRLRCN
jgi:hypothetical protein